MPNFTITIPGDMRGKGRPKFSTRGGHVRSYTDEKTVSTENWVKFCAIEQAGQPILEGPLKVTIHVGVKIPDSKPKKWKADAISGAVRPTGKPDFDNTAKLVCDALNGIMWKDDSQIVDAHCTKVYAEVPQTVITIETI